MSQKSGGGQGGSGGGKGGGGGQGGSQGAGWPSTTGNESGKGRDNNPPGGSKK